MKNEIIKAIAMVCLAVLVVVAASKSGVNKAGADGVGNPVLVAVVK